MEVDFIDLKILKLNTIFKLMTLKLEQPECDKLCRKVMKGNTAVVKKVIYTYIKKNTERKSSNYFYTSFVRKSSRRFLKRFDISQIKKLVSAELDSLLRHKFRRNLRNVKFQNIVDRAIECTQESCDERVQKHLPQWIKKKYKYYPKTTIAIEQEAEYNKNLINKMRDTKIVLQDVFELVNELEYYNHCKKQLALKTKIPEIPKTGIIDAFNYAEYYKVQWQQKTNWQDNSEKCKERINYILDNSDIPKEIKQEVRKNDYQIKKKSTKLFIGRIRRQFEEFIVYEKYGNVPDTYLKRIKGAMQLIRHKNVNFDYIEENPALELKEFLFNSVIVKKKRFIPFYEKLVAHKHIKLLKYGKYKTETLSNGKRIEYMYVIYDYLAPKKWFKKKFIDSVLEKMDESFFIEIPEEDTFSYSIPYYSRNNSIQSRFTTNFRIFCNKVGINGLSERIIEFDQKAIINPYQIYYPYSKRIDNRYYVTKEIRKRQYLNLYGCFYHEIKFGKDGLIEGGNIMKTCSYETGDIDMDFFVADIDARSFSLEEYIKVQSNFSLYFYKFFKDVQKYYKDSQEKPRLLNFLQKNKRKQLNNLARVLKKYIEFHKELKDLHGNSKRAKYLKTEIKKMSPEKIRKIRERIIQHRGLRKEVKRNEVKKYQTEFRDLMFESALQYCEVRYYRNVRVQRNVVSVAKLIANNLHIKGIVRTYKTKKDEFLHKFLFEYRKHEILLDEVCSVSTLLILLIKMSLALKDKELFEIVFDFLENLNLKNKEKKLLMEFKGY